MFQQVADFLTCFFFFALLHADFTNCAKFFQHPDDFSPTVDYDFVVAGGGTAGLVVATRLGENPKWKILIIEAGPSNDDVFATHVPGLSPGPEIDWNYTTTRQTHLNGRDMEYSQAKILGGCSSHNGMIYTRGSKDDWDRWADLSGNEDFRWDKILPLMMKGERFTQDIENQPVEGRFDPTVHGLHGKLSVTVSPLNVTNPFNDLLLQVTEDPGMNDEFPFLLDLNGGRPLGIGWRPATMTHNGERSSSATAYLGTTNDNVHVLLNTFVTRVLPAGDNKTDFRVVEFAADPQSPRVQVKARKEVIVAGGVIGSPQILLKSGIGKREELEAVGIKTLVNNPAVGKNFSDHAMVPAEFDTSLPTTDYDIDAAIAEWNKTHMGPASHSGHLNHVVWVRLPKNVSLGAADPTGGEDSPHIELSLVSINARTPEMIATESEGTVLRVSTVNLHPISRGSITLNSSDPFSYPLIDVNLLAQDLDYVILREALRSAQRLFSAPSFESPVKDVISPPANVTSDDELDAYIRSKVTAWIHGVGSLSMSPHGTSHGAVDPDFRVKGTQGLRVVDASIIPSTASEIGIRVFLYRRA
ncbi:CAZyme family AA3 [Agaricus bisporus var. burnettii]|uniref:pyranose dehydrogenase (acceptor) n=1 Tax=Agaricus bisporus var. burnettii TaxID=192524 RepID=A0A8H7C143_AGABI|nr:CAZyme family AA3 [Agaricus bisporus var. burnettii]